MLELCVFLIMVIAIRLAVVKRGWLRWVSAAVAAIIALPILAFFLLVAVVEMKQGGVWPFKPLASYHAERLLKNGGTLIFDGKEKRSSEMEWNAPPDEENGQRLSFTATYRLPGSDRVEQIASTLEEAFPSLENTEVYFPGQLIVVVTPGAYDLYVRSHVETPAQEGPSVSIPETSDERPALHSLSPAHLDERWQWLSLCRPDGQGTSPAIYSTFDSVPKEDLLKTCKDVAEDDHDTPTAKIVRFDPETRSLLMAFSGKRRVRYLSLRLSEDGTSLSLVKNERVGQDYTSAER